MGEPLGSTTLGAPLVVSTLETPLELNTSRGDWYRRHKNLAALGTNVTQAALLFLGTQLLTLC